MISVIIPTLDAQAGLTATLSALVPATVDGLVREVIVVDGGSRDRTLDLAEEAGVSIVKTTPGRGHQMRTGATKARFSWLMFLHADTVLEPGWECEARKFVDASLQGNTHPSAAVFRFALDDTHFPARMLEAVVALRTGLLKLPYGDQGLLISKRLYDGVGGYPDLPIMEDVAIVRRLGRSRITPLRSRATTSARRYREHGYLRRIARNQVCLALYAMGAPISMIERAYTRRPHSSATERNRELKSGAKL